MHFSSSQRWNINTKGNCLLLFDIHQNIAWAEEVLRYESGHFDHLILGGDYFDPTKRPPVSADIATTVAFLNDLLVNYAGKISVLLGNHDIPYYVASKLEDASEHPHTFSAIKGYRTESAAHIAKHLSPDFWSSAQLFAVAQGYLISHAGVSGDAWPSEANSIESNIEELWKSCQLALEEAPVRRHPLLTPGAARGGNTTGRGGITWLDWENEFEEGIPLPQIVGHSKSRFGARAKGSSWCLDGNQTCYGLLRDGYLTVRNI